MLDIMGDIVPEVSVYQTYDVDVYATVKRLAHKSGWTVAKAMNCILLIALRDSA